MADQTNKHSIKYQIIIVVSVLLFSNLTCQDHAPQITTKPGIIPAAVLDSLMTTPKCLEGFRPNQKGSLTRIDKNGEETTDSTFTVEKMSISSDGCIINGWLYLPKQEGRFPLVVLTNGGGDDSRPIKSFSEWIAPILAHCGFAAFVHDKGGTGQSQGNFIETTYDDYIRDAGNCAAFLSCHKKINPDLVGIAGGSEGRRIAVLAACRYPDIKFVISFAGTVVSMEEDRIYAQMGSIRASGISDSIIDAVTPLWKRSFAAWASKKPEELRKVNQEIFEWRKKYDRNILPFTKEEMDSIPEFRAVIPTWNSLSKDYLTELERFNKKWLAIFGEVDKVVPTQASINNIIYYKGISRNNDCYIAVIPKCGHSPVNVETKRLIRIDNLMINWLNEKVVNIPAA